MKRNKHGVQPYKFRVGTNIRKWRNLKDIKQKDLASALEISEAAVSNIENDMTNITIGQLEDISIALNVSLEQLLSDPQEKYRNYAEHKQQMPVQEQQVLDKELLNALISSLEKKDRQLELMMQQFLDTISLLMQKQKPFYKTAKPLVTSA